MPFKDWREAENWMQNPQGQLFDPDNPDILGQQQTEADILANSMRRSVDLASEFETFAFNIAEATRRMAESLELGAINMEKQADSYERLNRHAKERVKQEKLSADITDNQFKSLSKSVAKREQELKFAEKKKDALRELGKLERASGAELERQLDRLEMLDKRGKEGKFVGDQRLQDIQGLWRRGAEGQLSGTELNQYNDLRARIAVGMSQMGRTEDFNQGRLKSILEGARTGGLGGAGAAFMQLPASARMQQGWEKMIERGAARGLPIGGLTGLGKFMGPPGVAAISAGLYAFNRYGLEPWKEGTRTGQITGEGWQEGLRARAQAFTAGVNPFDLVSRQQAMEINKTLREKGFRGGEAGAMTDAVADIVNDLGIGLTEAAEDATFAVREGGMSIDEFRDSMKSLDDTAKTAGVSIETARASIIDFAEETARRGGAGAYEPAIAAATGIQEVFGRSPALRGMSKEDRIKFLSGIQPQLATLYGGFSPLFASSRAAVDDLGRQIDAFLQHVRGGQGDMPIEQYAQILRVQASTGVEPYASFFGGASVEQIIGMLKASPTAYQDAQHGKKREQTKMKAKNLVEEAREFRTQVSKAWVLEHGTLQQQEAVAAEEGAYGIPGSIVDEAAYGQRIRDRLKAAGVSPGRINDIMAPLARAVRAGDESAWRDALEGVEERVQKVYVEVGMTPEMQAGWYANTDESAVARAAKRPQGAVRYPRSNRRQ